MTNNLDDEVKKILALPGLQIDDTDEEYMRYLEEKIIKVIRLKEKLISEEDLFALVQKEIPNFNQQYARIKENLARTNAKTDTRFGISICFELIDLFAMLDYCSTEEEFASARDNYFKRLAQEPLFQGYDYIFPGLKDISLEQVQNIYDEVINNVDYLTPEWSGKMRSIVDIRKPLFINNEVNPEVFSFDYLDKIANFARQHGMKMRLHNIIWHQDFRPPFASLAKDKLLMFLDTYMQILNRRYGDVIYAVDILNEIASDEKDEVLRSSKWKDILGEDYYIDILRLAKKNFGSIPLYYNEYGEDRQEKRANVLAIIAKIKEIEQQEQITLLDGIGIQAHYNTDTPDQAIKDAYLDYAKTDKILAISEFDVTNKGNSDTFDYQTNRVYRTVLDMATSLNINLFNIWGVSQNISWKSGNVNNFLDATGKVSVYTKKICQAYSAKQKKENLLKNEL